MKPILLLGEFPTESDIKINSTFCSPGGVELLRMLGEAGVISLSPFDRDYIHRYYATNNPELIDAVWNLHPEILRANVFNQRPAANDIDWFCGPKSSAIPGYPALTKKFVQKEHEHELDRLSNYLLQLDPNLVVLLGNAALWAIS